MLIRDDSFKIFCKDEVDNSICLIKQRAVQLIMINYLFFLLGEEAYFNPSAQKTQLRVLMKKEQRGASELAMGNETKALEERFVRQSQIGIAEAVAARCFSTKYPESERI